ncbi:MAG: cytochrome c oxidase subunit 3 family protein [Thermoanaerobaculia bacterium]
MSEAAHAHPGLHHQFDSYEQQRQSASLGMWAFLVNEVMFFGGMFLAYAYYRHRYGHEFAAGSHSLDISLGAFNTAVLIGSSLTMALAVRAAQMGRNKAIVAFLIATMVLGSVFLGVKVIEYSDKFEHHHVPGPSFVWHDEAGSGKYAGADPFKIQIYFSLYFAMTGFHALHMIVGIGIMLFMLRPAWKGKWNLDNHNFVEGFGLYWHFVDIVWIFLFPLLYLIGRS